MYNPKLNAGGYTTPMEAELGPRIPAEAAEVGRIPSVGDFFRILWKRLWAILLVTIVLVGVAVGFSFWLTPTYQASVKVLIGQEQKPGEASNLGSDVQGLQQLASTMVEGVKSRPVAEAVIQQLGLQTTPEDVLQHLKVEQIRQTQYIRVSYEDSSPERARQVADSIGSVFSEQVSRISTSANAVTATVWEGAVVPNKPVSPDPLRNGLLALALGLMLGVGLALLLETLDDRWRSPEEAEQISGVPTFGVIPELKPLTGKKEGG